MRRLLLSASVSLALCGTALASGRFIELQTPEVFVTRVSPNGAYAVGTSIEDSSGYRWTASSGAEEVLTELGNALSINDAGVVAGAVFENGGANKGGRDFAAYGAPGTAPVLLSQPLMSNSAGYDIAADGTVVGLAFDDGFFGNALAFVWNAAEGMTALPVPRPQNLSRANAISANGHVIAGWNDQDSGDRTAVIWLDRVPFDVLDAKGFAVGEASAVSPDGRYVIGSEYIDADWTFGAWRWSAEHGVEMIPGMTYAFGVSADGKTVVGNTDFFDDPPRAPMIWREGIGTIPLADYLAEQGIEVPPEWDLSGGLGGLSADGRVLAGWAFGPLGLQSYIVRIDGDDAIFRDGFEPSTR